MKRYLSAIVLLYTGQYALADTTFEFNRLKDGKSQPVNTYYIKAQQLKYAEASSENMNIYQHDIQQFNAFDSKTAGVSTLNEELLNKHIFELNKQRLDKLREVETKLQQKIKDMNAVQQQAAESLINQLKYPEFYGQHTLLKIKPVSNTRLVNKIECKPYQLYRNDILLRQFCMATPESLKMSKKDYQTLRGFYAFDYKMQSKVLIAMGKTGFTMIDYEQQNMPGVVIEILTYKDKQTIHHVALGDFNHQALSDSIFTLKSGKK